jgi:hypothetical protein
MNSGNFFSELKRRNVYKVAVAYAVVGWLVIQIATSTFPVLEIPNWAWRERPACAPSTIASPRFASLYSGRLSC